MEALEYELATVAHTIAASYSETTFSTDELTDANPSTHIDLRDPVGWDKEPHKTHPWEVEKMVAPSPPNLQQKLRTELTIKCLVRLPSVCISRPVVAAASVDESLENPYSEAVEAAAAVAADAAANNKQDQRQVDEEKSREEENARQYKGLGKRAKIKFTRILRDGSQQQQTTIFNYMQARTDLGLPANARSVQIASAIAPPRPRIPLKEYLLRFNKALTKDIRYLTKENNVKNRKISTMEQKNKNLETAIRDLTKQIL